MWSKYLLPTLSALGLVLAIIAVIISQKTPPTPPIPFSPPTPEFDHFVAGEGLVEAESEDFSIGTPYTEIVEEVFVEAGEKADQGAPLFKLNTQDLEARLAQMQAGVEIAEAEYQKQLDLPRKIEVPPYEMRVRQAEAALLNQWTQYELVDKVTNPKAISKDEYNQRKYEALRAKYVLEEAEAELTQFLAGAWVKDLEISRAQVKEAKMRMRSVEVEIERSTIRAPIDGYVFRVNIQPGELAQATETSESLVLFGSIDPLHIRVDIDEDEVWRVIKGAPGIAYIRGNSSLNVPLKYVRLEPYLVPKRSLSGAITEQVDTRVLQIIYEFDRGDLPIFPGMLMDVFLEAEPSGAAIYETAQ